MVGRPVSTHAHPYQISLNGVEHGPAGSTGPAGSAGQAGTGASVVDGRSAS